ncbi:hypothetical protein MNBD_CHLOROFLEXI01-3046 [hydrothermal vent metagenome]|uniref:DUF3320 domain-containing protein n=1 Tax=hydrothermal vent metagenome TaxID=652676 RepID=A0A3B0UH76_9ZZZZ
MRSQEYRQIDFQRTHRRGAEDFHNTPTWGIARAIKNLVEEEGPIHKDVVKRRIAGLFQVRMGSRISQKLDDAILNAEMKNGVKANGNFLWSENGKNATLRIYNGGKSKRLIEHIPLQEIALAIIECVQNSISISEDDLVKETARLFGLRATRKVSTKIKRVIRILISANKLTQKSEKILMGL